MPADPGARFVVELPVGKRDELVGFDAAPILHHDADNLPSAGGERAADSVRPHRCRARRYARARVPTIDQLPPACPSCGSAIYTDGKETSSGTDSWMYFCEAHCGWLEVFIGGVSLWKAMSDAKHLDPKP
jgi:hypothetical protein